MEKGFTDSFVFSSIILPLSNLVNNWAVVCLFISITSTSNLCAVQYFIYIY